MLRILVMLSAATRMPLTDGRTRTVGFWPEEVTEPLAVFDKAGVHVTTATPDGRPAEADPAGFTPEGTGLSPDGCQALRDAVEGHRERLADPVSLQEIRGEAFDAVFVPGGYAPMIDLWCDPHCGRILADAHRAGRPVAAVCHGPAALLSCTDAQGNWLFTGYRMTSFTDAEEKDVALLDVLPWTSQQSLVRQGAHFSSGPEPWAEHLVEDRGLLTGQNPASARPLAERLLARLDGGQPPAA